MDIAQPNPLTGYAAAHAKPTDKKSRIVLLDAMQSYFEYVVHTLCGIPTITLEGTQEDWKDLAARVQGFREFGLELWLDVLSPILDQFALRRRFSLRHGDLL